MDQGPKGSTGHDSSNGDDMSKRVLKFCKPTGTYGENIHYGKSNGMEIVLGLIIDDDVPSRGHRSNIYNKEFLTVGIATGPHKVFGEMCNMDLAAGCSGGVEGALDLLKEFKSKSASSKQDGSSRSKKRPAPSAGSSRPYKRPAPPAGPTKVYKLEGPESMSAELRQKLDTFMKEPYEFTRGSR